MSGLSDRVRILRPLRHRDFRLLWTGMTASLIGDGIFLVALAWQVYELSNVPTALSIVGVAMTLPQILFLLDRRRGERPVRPAVGDDRGRRDPRGERGGPRCAVDRRRPGALARDDRGRRVRGRDRVLRSGLRCDRAAAGAGRGPEPGELPRPVHPSGRGPHARPRGRGMADRHLGREPRPGLPDRCAHVRPVDRVRRAHAGA